MPRREPREDIVEVDAESEEDVEAIREDQIRQTFITSSDWTTETLITQIRKGNINLSPAFQRREVWNNEKKCHLIESIIMNLPIPQLVLAERKEDPNTYLVLDGKQRLLAIHQFCIDKQLEEEQQLSPLHLEKLSLLAHLDGETYMSLKSNPDYEKFVNAFDNQTIRTVVIRNWPDDSYLHHVFHRLNTGSVRLSPQELRQALYPGPFTNFVEDFAPNCEELQRALGNRKPDFRMRDNEVFLRYMSFAFRAREYPGNLKKFLDDSTVLFNNTWAEMKGVYLQATDDCQKAIVATQEIFGETHSFATYNGEEFETRFNRAVFDIMTYYFRESAVREAAIEMKEQVKESFKRVSSEHIGFKESLIATTKSKVATATRFVVWAEILTAETGLTVAPPDGFADILAEK